MILSDGAFPMMGGLVLSLCVMIIIIIIWPQWIHVLSLKVVKTF